jgi:iron complex transport system substrate-binding protein
LGASIEALGLKTYYLDLESPESFYRDLEGLGAALGMIPRANDLIAYYRGLQADTEKRVAGLPKPRVLLAQASDSGQSWDIAPAGWMQSRLVEMAGGVNVGVTERGASWTKVGAEQIAVWNPEVVIVVSYSKDATAAAKAFRDDPRFAQTAAVKANAVHAMAQDFYSWDQADTRWILGLRRLGTYLHPERFADLDASAEVRRFFEFLYGVTSATFNASLRPVLKGEHGVQ